MHRAGQPLAAIADSRYALSAEGVGAARPVACGSRVAASRYALGAEGVGATRPGEYICSHPDACARCLLVVGMSKTSCASRCSRRSVQGALRAPAEGEGGLARREDLTAAAAATLGRSAGTVAHGTRGGVFQTLSCTSVRGNACVLAQHVQCKSARRATATGALYPQARPTSRTLSARARLHAAAVAAS